MALLASCKTNKNLYFETWMICKEGSSDLLKIGFESLKKKKKKYIIWINLHASNKLHFITAVKTAIIRFSKVKSNKKKAT